jgi:hypothetical protein
MAERKKRVAAPKVAVEAVEEAAHVPGRGSFSTPPEVHKGGMGLPGKAAQAAGPRKAAESIGEGARAVSRGRFSTPVEMHKMGMRLQEAAEARKAGRTLPAIAQTAASATKKVSAGLAQRAAGAVRAVPIGGLGRAVGAIGTKIASATPGLRWAARPLTGWLAKRALGPGAIAADIYTTGRSAYTGYEAVKAVKGLDVHMEAAKSRGVKTRRKSLGQMALESFTTFDDRKADPGIEVWNPTKQRWE